MEFDYIKFKEDRKKIMTAEELSGLTGMPVTTIQNIDNGRRKSTTEEEYRILCEAAGLNFDDYLLSYKRPYVIVVLTNKGGAGKTTVTVNLAGALASEYNKKCLVIDTDLQQNTTMHLGMLYPLDDSPEEAERIRKIEEEASKKNIYEAFVNKDDIQNHIMHTKWDKIDIVMSCDAMSTIDKEMFSMRLGELRMQEVLSNLMKENANMYDYVIIDCNPNLSQMNESCLFAADYVIIPLEAAPFGLRGVQYVVDFIEGVRENKKDLKTLGILLNKYDGRKNITKDISAALYSVEDYKDKLFETKIPVDTSIEQSQGFGEPLFVSFKRSNAYRAYKALAKEVITRIGSDRIDK